MKTSPPGRSWARAALLATTAPALLWLVGCSASLLPKPPPAAARYTLDSPVPVPVPAAAPAVGSAPVLLVAQISAAPGYDSVRMLYLRQPQQLEAFAFHEWVEPPARLLGPLMVRALQDTQAFQAVLPAPSSGTGGWRLETELLRLQQDFNAQPSTVRLTLRAVLIDTATRRVIATQVFDGTAPAGRDDPVAGAAAAQQLTQRVLGELATACAAWVRAAAAAAAVSPTPRSQP